MSVVKLSLKIISVTTVVGVNSCRDHHKLQKEEQKGMRLLRCLIEKLSVIRFIAQK